MTTTVNDIEHIESESLNGMGVIKVFFHPNVKIDMAIAQITAICQSTVRGLPPGITPPMIITYNASSVPILQLSLSSKTLSESQVNDLAMIFCGSGWPRCKGPPCPMPTAAKPARSWWILTSRPCTARAFPPATWSTPSVRKT
jgi:hypothetical protein